MYIINYLQQFEDAQKVLVSMKNHLENTLDIRAEENTDWGPVWSNYRENGGNLAAIIPSLPKYAQIQYSQIAELASFLKAVQQTIKDLQVEADEAYSRGVARGKEILERERRGPTFRERAFYNREGARQYSIESSSEYFNI